MCNVYCVLCTVCTPAGLGVGGDEVEDEAHHHAGRHDDAGVGEDGRVDGQQTWASNIGLQTCFLRQSSLLFRLDNRLSHLHHQIINGTSVK